MIKCLQVLVLVMNVCMFMQVYQDTPGVEHIPVVQIDLSVPLKVPGKPTCEHTLVIFILKGL